MNTGANKTSDSKYGGETQNEGWTGGSVRHKNWWNSGQSGNDECVHTDTGPETTYCRGTEFNSMGGYDFPGQIATSDGSEGHGVMGAVL
jgi:hypothetical protein